MVLEDKKKENQHFLKKNTFFKICLGNVWFIICGQVTNLCLQLDGSYKTPIIFFYSENNSDFLNRPPNTNLYNVQCLVICLFFKAMWTGKWKTHGMC